LKYPDDFINQIICGDCLEVMKEMPDKCVDLVLTDPPYNMASLCLVKGLLGESERILKEGGNLLFLCGHHQLFSILEIHTKLRKWWIGWLNHNRSNRIFGKNLITKGKPFLWYSNKIRKNSARVPFDTITLSKEEWSKAFHKQEQPIGFFSHYIEFLTRENDIIFDPFLGSGTTALACRKLKRNFIGIEINPDYCKIAEERLAQGVL